MALDQKLLLAFTDALGLVVRRPIQQMFFPLARDSQENGFGWKKRTENG
jgi:hypothetical protein